MNVSYILSAPRSGSTLLSVLLSRHPDIYCPPEPWLLLGLDSLGHSPSEHPAEALYLANAVDAFLGESRYRVLNEAAHAIYQSVLNEKNKKLFIDKTPRYYLCPDLLRECLRKSKAILLLRNPLDVAASYLTTWNINLANVVGERQDSPVFLDYVLSFRRFLELHAENPQLVVRYEDLVVKPETEMGRVFEYLGIQNPDISTALDPQLAGHAQSAFGDKKILASSTVHSQSLNSYKQIFNRDEIAVLLNALGEGIFDRLGYGNVYREACQEFAIEVLPDFHEELFATAEHYLVEHRARCATPASHAHLVQQLQQVTAENADLTQQLRKFTDMGIREHVQELRRLVKHRGVKSVAVAGFWRMIIGAPPILPKITVVTPVFNGAAHIAETLESVLRQDYPFLEYIVVDGGSTDGTLDIIRSYQKKNDLPQRIARVISEPDQGMYDAIAKGFEHATGEIFCYLNADDLFDCGGLRSVGEYFARHPKTQVIYHEDTVNVDGWRYPNVRQPEGIGTVDLLDGHILFQDGVFWRRSAYEAIRGVSRDIRLAGDFDLWLRLSGRFRFVRRPGHVSCFRVRPGQLSLQMDKYRSEMQQSIEDFMASASFAKRVRWTIQKSLRRLPGRPLRNSRRDRLFFPIDFGNMPPPVISVPAQAGEIPRSPIDGKPAERLLFSTPDTRFGERELNYVYLDARHGIAITHPLIAADKLDGLYRKYYSSPPTELKLPEGASPYRQFDGKRLWERVLLRLPVERLARLFPNAWTDNTFAELTKVLKAAQVDMSKPLRFLDMGCFEGRLLDQVRERTPWHCFGLEPNNHAVQVARSKGHSIWQGHAEGAVEIISQDQQFDVIFMGQSIEHVDDPVRVLRRLRLLLAPGGVLVMSTPNLDSREIDWFGPTWAHWHAPYHRYIFSRNGLFALARQVGLSPIHFQTFSSSYWTAMSVSLNRMGLGGSASHAVSFERAVSIQAQRIHFWQCLLWNRIGKGDYSFFVVKDGADE